MGKGGLGLAWKQTSGNLWQVQLPANTQPFEYLFYNGERRLRSRVQSPNGTGYLMRGGYCYSTVTRQTADPLQCNLGTCLRIASPVDANEPAGEGCPSSSNRRGRRKCLDRFHYFADDPITEYTNLTSVNSPFHDCRSKGPGLSYPQGDIEVMIFDSWSVDYMRLSCIDTTTHTLYFIDKTFSTPAGMTFNNLGPIGHHRYIIENTKEAFDAAHIAGQGGLWFLDRSTSPWTLNYLANKGENPNTIPWSLRRYNRQIRWAEVSSRHSISNMSPSAASPSRWTTTCRRPPASTTIRTPSTRCRRRWIAKAAGT